MTFSEFHYIERLYNPVRKHSKLDLLSPVQFEEGFIDQPTTLRACKSMTTAR